MAADDAHDRGERVRALWRELAGAPDAFRDDGVLVVAADGHRVSPPGWIGIVELGTSVVVACPSDQLDRVRDAVERIDVHRLTDPTGLATRLPLVAALGPAELFYGVPEPGAPGTPRVVGPLDVGDDRVVAVLADAAVSELEESAVESTTSGLDVAIGRDGVPAAVCGWRVWPHDVAHVGCLTARSARRTGAGEAAARAALRRAASGGLLPMWRAAAWNAPSIALARRLGLSRLGRQFSLRLD